MSDLDRLRPVALLCDADGNLFPSEEPAFVASAVVTNQFLAELGISERVDAEQLRLGTTGKNFRTTAVDLAQAHGLSIEPAVDGPGAEARQVRAPGDVLSRQVLDHWVQEEKRRVSAHLAAVLR